MRPTDIDRIATVSDLTSRGDLTLVAVTRPDLDTDSYVSRIEKILADGPAEPFTFGPHDTAPAISPDGRWVAFLRAGQDAPAQIALIATGGGDARVLTDLPLGAGAPVWSPDSRALAFAARRPTSGRNGVPDESGKVRSAGEEAPRVIDRLDYRIDNVGFLRERIRQIGLIEVAAEQGSPGTRSDAEVRWLTDAQADVEKPVWTDDGAALVFSAPRDLGREETLASDLWLVAADGSAAPRLLVRSAGDAGYPVIDAGRVYYLGHDQSRGVVAGSTSLWVAEPDWSGEGVVEGVALTDEASVDLAGITPVLTDAGVVVGVLTRGRVALRALPLPASGRVGLADLVEVLGGGVVVGDVVVDDGVVWAAAATPDSAGVVIRIAGGDVSRTADWSAPLRDSGLCRVEELEGVGPQGYPVHGWLVLPEGDGPHPVLHVVHGGPHAQQDVAFFDEAQVYASAGFAVILGNPRGSAGYGDAHGRAIVGALGTHDVEDVLALLDVALQRDDLDASRVGIMGGSYGGFMTSWLASHHGERFVAAWSERAVNAWDSFLGSSDIGYYFAEGYTGSDPAELRARSPLYYAGDVRIPFTVAHSEEDWRCPLEQGQRMFVALRKAGVDTQFVLFPGEGHELSRSGRPTHRVARFDLILDWWTRYLAS